MYDVAITGIGIVSTLGTGIDKVKTSLEQGTSGIGIDPERKELGFRSALTGIIDDFEPPQMPRKQRKTLSDFGLQCYAAALEATEMAGWSQEDIQTTRTGLIIGNDSSSHRQHPALRGRHAGEIDLPHRRDRDLFKR